MKQKKTAKHTKRRNGSKANAPAEARVETKAAVTAEAKAPAKAEPKTAVKTEAKAEPKAEVKAAAKTEAKAEVKAATKTEAKVEPKAEVKAVAKAPAEKAEKVQAKPANRSAAPASNVVKTWYASQRHNIKRARLRWHHLVREKRETHFPESERLPVQLLLLAWGQLPVLGCKLRELLMGRRKRNIHSANRVAHWFETHKIRPVTYVAGACALAAVALFFSAYTFGTTVTYDGEVVAALSSRSQAEDVQSSLEKVTTRTLGESFTIDDSLLHYSTSLMRRQDVVDENTFEEELSEEIGLVTHGYALYINGERMGATPYEGALEELLEQLQAAAVNEDTISCTFEEDVEIREEYVPSEEIMNLGYLAETLYSTKQAEVNYTVKKGDTWSQIANSHGLTSKELLALNPGYDINKLQIGEVLTLSASVPYLTMTVVQRERYTEDIPYNIEYTPTDSMFLGDYQVTSPGEYGAADVVANVTYVNGEEVERTVLSSVTLRDPVAEHQLQGTKVRPTWYPTGTFRWPVTGRITSGFGRRNSPGGIGSRNHKGIDIGAPGGTPVCAADGGTVTYAGWMGGYGYVVIINHNGTGYETRYGHNSKIDVSVGEHVYKGQQIARVGSTGNSTGNHCHFEVRYHGVPKNPRNYI